MNIVMPCISLCVHLEMSQQRLTGLAPPVYHPQPAEEHTEGEWAQWAAAGPARTWLQAQGLSAALRLPRHIALALQVCLAPAISIENVLMITWFFASHSAEYGGLQSPRVGGLRPSAGTGLGPLIGHLAF